MPRTARNDPRAVKGAGPRGAFTETLGRNDDEAVIATEALFFALRSAPACCVELLQSGLLAPRPAAILLARVWHSGPPDTELLDLADPQRLIVPLFRQARDQAGDVLMHHAGWPLYQALPETLTVYRGSRLRAGDLNPSWTLDLEWARWFADRSHDAEPRRILAAEVSKADVLAVFSIVGEREVLVDPVGLRNVRVVE